MPKCYSDQEREYIKNRLKEEASKCLAQYGIRRTTVDEIVRRVKIPKGTFYLFYQSKELLLFEVMLEQHEMVDQQLLEEVGRIDAADMTVERLTEVIVHFYQLIDDIPVLKLLTSGEVELLARKLPPEVLTEHLGHDRSMVDELLEVLPVKKEVDTKALSAAFRAIFFSMIHKEEIGEEFDKALYMMVFGLVEQLL